MDDQDRPETWLAEWTSRDRTTVEDVTFADASATALRAVSVHFEECTFRRLVLHEAHFTSCRFLDCRFEDCDLSGARFPDSTFRGGTFARCKLSGTDLSVSPTCAVDAFEACRLDGAILVGLALPKLRIEGGSARGAAFEGADLREAVLRDVDLTEARFGDADLRRADLRGSHGYVIDPRTTRVEGLRCTLPAAAGLLVGLGVRID